MVTVRQLIETLSKAEVPQDAIVSLAGCDCYGAASGEIRVHEDRDARDYLSGLEPNVQCVTLERED